MGERRRLTTDVYGLISSDRALEPEAGASGAGQVVSNLPRGTVVEIDKDDRGRTRVRAGVRAFLPNTGDLLRILRASAPV